MAVDLHPTPDPPEASEAAPAAQLPPQLAQIWRTFASRELARGRRDISNLVEVTLQFALEHESANLKPMIVNLNRLEGWEAALTQEAAVLQKRLATSEGDLAQPYQRVNILLNRADEAAPTAAAAPLRRVQVDAPVTSRPVLMAHLEQMQKQQQLISHAAAEHLQALQTRRGEIAARLRHYASQMHQMAGDMLAGLADEPPAGLRPQQPPPTGPALDPGGGTSGGTGSPAPPPLGGLGGRLRKLDLAGLAQRCLRALARSYRAGSERVRKRPSAGS